MDEVAQALLRVGKQWCGETLPQANALKEALGIHHNRTQAPIPSKFIPRVKNTTLVCSLKLSKGEVMTAKGLGRNPQNRIKKNWMQPIFSQTEELGKQCTVAVSEAITKTLHW